VTSDLLVLETTGATLVVVVKAEDFLFIPGFFAKKNCVVNPHKK
jgi:K+/H+ antiporter YhaU regulatory subunit KhtT